MKILHALMNYEPSVGGTQLLFKHISNYCATKHKDEVIVATINSFYGPHVSQFKEIEQRFEVIDGVKIYRFPFFRFHRKLFAFLNSIIAKVFGKPSVIINDYLLGPWSPSLKKFISNADVDVIVGATIGYSYMKYPLYRHQLKNPKPFVFQGAIHFHDGKEHLEITSAMLQAIKASEYYLCNTVYEKEVLVNMGVSHEQIVISRAGADVDKYAKGNGNNFREKFDLLQDDVAIVFLGRIVESKGIDILIEAFSLIYYQNNKLKLFICGFETDYVQELEKSISKFSTEISSKIQFVLNPPEEDKIDILHGMDLLALPSTNESLGMVLIEAWSCKKPVIGASIGAIRSVIDDGKDGLLFRPNSAQHLGDCILQLAGDESLRKSLGNAGYYKAKEHYDWPVVTKIVRETYVKAVEKFNRKYKKSAQ